MGHRCHIRRGRTEKQRAELHARLLDRITGNQELLALLNPETGRHYLGLLDPGQVDPRTRILTGIQTGIVLILLGVSLLSVRVWQDDDLLRNGLLLIGVPSTAIGLAFLISAAVSHRFLRSWGLLDKG